MLGIVQVWIRMLSALNAEFFLLYVLENIVDKLGGEIRGG
jgi:hypothetical protein